MDDIESGYQRCYCYLRCRKDCTVHTVQMLVLSGHRERMQIRYCCCRSEWEDKARQTMTWMVCRKVKRREVLQVK